MQWQSSSFPALEHQQEDEACPWPATHAKATAPARALSVITQFDGLMFTLRDGQGGKDLQQNGTGIATGAVLAMSD